MTTLIGEIGAIPESIEHDSSAEKLFAKAADIVLAKCLQELGLHAAVNKQRADCADVFAKSRYHEYSFVGDAKAFRLSRTAKNQKDFKVKSMRDWRGDHNYSVLVCPYFQYPKKTSQIYGQALDDNVCLLSWEHLLFFIRAGVRESEKLNLANVWSLSEQLAEKVTVRDKNRKDNFHRRGNELICKHLSLPYDELKAELLQCRQATEARAETEIEFWMEHVKEVEQYTREQAIAELIAALKVHEKIAAIRNYIKQLPKDDKIG
ncbi:MAG: HindIII family type II restriction endonuclease [Pirellulaceae bacterium]|nr:HindIII family type II restriction endonuclease [Pirellulaceae bacterium]